MKPNKDYNRDFDASKSSTICYIHINNIEIPVRINRTNASIILKFSFNGKHYISSEIIINRPNDYVSSDLERIKFDGIEIHEIDLENLSKCIDEIFDFTFD